MSNRTRTRDRASTRQRPTPQDKGGLPPWVPIGILGAVVLVIVIGFLAASQSEDEGDSLAFGDVEYLGEPLPARPESGPDAAVGMPAPVMRGFSPDSVEQRFANGSPRALLYVAHWCGFCQAELDAVNAWLDAGNDFPAGVEIQTVSTWADRGKPNFPPGEWLADNDWDGPTIVDDEDSTLATNSGLSGTPMWIFVDAEGTIVDRTGALTPEQLEGLLGGLVSADDGAAGSDQG